MWDRIFEGPEISLAEIAMLLRMLIKFYHLLSKFVPLLGLCEEPTPFGSGWQQGIFGGVVMDQFWVVND